MENNLVSIITPSYKSKKFIAQAIESVISQTYINWEMIIVDDCSPDDSTRVIEEYIKKDSRIKLIKLEKNSGAAVARNRGIKESKGKYIAFLDADDLWLEDKLEIQVEFINKYHYSFVYCYYDIIDEENNSLDKIIVPPKKVSYKDLLKSNYIGCLTAMYDTSKLGKIYMPLIKKRQDYGLWLSILKKTDFAYCIPRKMASYRISKNSISSNKVNLLKFNYLLFREHEKFSVFKSVYYLVWNIFIKILSQRNKI